METGDTWKLSDLWLVIRENTPGNNNKRRFESENLREIVTYRAKCRAAEDAFKIRPSVVITQNLSMHCFSVTLCELNIVLPTSD